MIPQPARCEPTSQEFTLSPETVSCAPNCQAIATLQRASAIRCRP